MRRALALDYLVGLTHLMVAFKEKGKKGKVGYDYFSYNAGPTILVSAYGVPRYARRAKRPYEAALGSLVVGAVLAELSPKLEEFHDETRGCLFDLNWERDSIVKSFRVMTICGECLPKIAPRLHGPAHALLEALRGYRTEETGEQPS